MYSDFLLVYPLYLLVHIARFVLGQWALYLILYFIVILFLHL